MRAGSGCLLDLIQAGHPGGAAREPADEGLNAAGALGSAHLDPAAGEVGDGAGCRRIQP